MSKRNWLISLIACAGISSLSLPVRGQAVLPYVPKLDSEKIRIAGIAVASRCSAVDSFSAV